MEKKKKKSQLYINDKCGKAFPQTQGRAFISVANSPAVITDS